MNAPHSALVADIGFTCNIRFAISVVYSYHTFSAEKIIYTAVKSTYMLTT